MPDKTVKLYLKVKTRKRLQRLAVETGVDHPQVIARALKALERTRRRNPPATDPGHDAAAYQEEPSQNRFRIRCEIEGPDTAEMLEQLQGLVNEIARWLRAQGAPESEIPMMLVALGAQCIREGERSQRFQDEHEARREE